MIKSQKPVGFSNIFGHVWHMFVIELMSVFLRLLGLVAAETVGNTSLEVDITYTKLQVQLRVPPL